MSTRHQTPLTAAFKEYPACEPFTGLVALGRVTMSLCFVPGCVAQTKTNRNQLEQFLDGTPSRVVLESQTTFLHVGIWGFWEKDCNNALNGHSSSKSKHPPPPSLPCAGPFGTGLPGGISDSETPDSRMPSGDSPKPPPKSAGVHSQGCGGANRGCSGAKKSRYPARYLDQNLLPRRNPPGYLGRNLLCWDESPD